MKRLITLLFCLVISVLTYLNFDLIVNTILKYIDTMPEVVVEKPNAYSRKQNNMFVKTTTDFIPYSYQDLKNIIYTVLDSGYTSFTFYCPREYLDCIDDVQKISDPKKSETLTSLGNYVSPFNNFVNLKVLYDTTGEVTINVVREYTDDEITRINHELDNIWSKIVTPDMTDKDIIYAFHDYIINNTKYDQDYEEAVKRGEKPNPDSSKATGVLFNGKAICSGYTDTMALVLDRLKLKNFKVASSSHVWNVVYIDNEYKHIDLTWDDPISQYNDEDTLLHNFYLIDTEKLEEFDIQDHTFNKSIYLELKQKESE